MNQIPATDSDTILQLLDATVTRARCERAAWEATRPAVCIEDRRQAVANLPQPRAATVVA